MAYLPQTVVTLSAVVIVYLLALAWRHRRFDRASALLAGLASVAVTTIALGLLVQANHTADLAQIIRHRELQIAELERTLSTTQDLRDRLTGELDMALRTLRSQEAARDRLVDQLELAVQQTRSTLETKRDELVVPGIIARPDVTRFSGIETRVARMISDITALRDIHGQARPRLEAQVTGDERPDATIARDHTQTLP